MREAANLAEFQEGHFPNMALYHTKDTHFDLLVANSSRLITSGLLGRARENKVEQESSHLQVEPGGKVAGLKARAAARLYLERASLAVSVR